MDYEKLYKDALERARESLEDGGISQNSIDYIQSIFPELKESEDERIRKELITHCRNTRCVTEEGAERISKWIAWLEKQCDQNFTDKVEPKFNNGQWIVWKCKYYKVNYNGCGYELIGQDGLSTSLEYKTVEESAHLWTIKDAKDGDVLLFEGYYNSIVLFQGIGINGKGRINYHCKCDLGNYSFGVQSDVACLGNIEKNAEQYHPASKEQCDLLFSKMKEAGYEWDVENKELKKIHVIDEGKSEMDYCFTKMMNGEQVSSAWSGEDEMISLSIEQIFNCASLLNIVPDKIEKVKNWLKSLKYRMKGE